jgi:hypothetical protein
MLTLLVLKMSTANFIIDIKMNRLPFFALFMLLSVLYKPSLAQTNSTTIRGRVLGQDLEELQGVKIINMCNADTATTNKRGFYKIFVSKGDTLVFVSNHYNQWARAVKRVADNVNVVMINRKTAVVTGSPKSDEFKKAAKEDDKLYEILDKGAERNGQWNY